jgi:hypothetical protein
VAEPASGSAKIVNGNNGELEERKSSLQDDFVPLPSKTPRSQPNAKQEVDIAENHKQAISPDGRALDALDQDSKVQSATIDSKRKESTDHGGRDVYSETNRSVAQKLHAQALTSNPNVHKRFGSEEPVLVDGEAASTELRKDDQEAGSAHGDGDGDASSDDDAPEIYGSKSAAKNVKVPVKALRKAKRKAKPSEPVNQQAAATGIEREPAEEDPIFVDTLPEQASNNTSDLHPSTPEPLSNRTRRVSTEQPPKKRKLFDESERKPKDIIKDGVTYRTISDLQPIVLESKRHKTSHLPPKSNANSWRLRKQVSGRNRVQHVWGGRSAFLRS